MVTNTKAACPDAECWKGTRGVLSIGFLPTEFHCVTSSDRGQSIQPLNAAWVNIYDENTVYFLHCNYAERHLGILSFKNSHRSDTTVYAISLCPNAWSMGHGSVQAAWRMMTSSNGNIFRVTGHLCGEFTGPRWIPRTMASNAELWCFICVWINGWVNNREAGDLRRYRAHYDVIVMGSRR